MDTNYCIDALEILLDPACLSERYAPLIPYRRMLLDGFRRLGCETKRDAEGLPDAALLQIGLKDAEVIRLLRRFLALYDPNPGKFREIDRATADPEEQAAFRELYCLPGVKYIRASLYYRAGYRCLRDFAESTPEKVIEAAARAIAEGGLSCAVPLPKEVRTQIAAAKAFLGYKHGRTEDEHSG